jgi:hypothetical protein
MFRTGIGFVNSKGKNMSHDTELDIRQRIAQTPDKKTKSRRRINNRPLFIAFAAVGMILLTLCATVIYRKAASGDRESMLSSSVLTRSAKISAAEITSLQSSPIVRETPRQDFRVVKSPDTSISADSCRIVMRIDKAGIIRLTLHSGSHEWEFICENGSGMRQE